MAIKLSQKTAITTLKAFRTKVMIDLLVSKISFKKIARNPSTWANSIKNDGWV
jgi:hypothetical protein